MKLKTALAEPSALTLFAYKSKIKNKPLIDLLYYNSY